MLSFRVKMKSWRFKIHPVCGAFSKSDVYSWRFSVDGRLNRRNKAVF